MLKVHDCAISPDDRLIASAPARVVTVTSSGHRGASLDFENLQSERTFDPMVAYQCSKLCNILFTRELARRFADTGLTANCFDPGPVASDLGRDLTGPLGMWLTRAMTTRGLAPQEGARTGVYLASAPEIAPTNGLYFYQGHAILPSPAAQDDSAARKLWDISAKLAGI